RRIAAGDWLGDRPFYMDPLYPYFLAVVYRVWGRDLLLVGLLQVALAAGSCALVAVVGARVAGPGVGWLRASAFRPATRDILAARNRHLAGEWVLTTSQAGQNFYPGNNPTNPWGAYGALPFVRSNPHFEEADFRAAAEARVGHPLGPHDVSRFWFGEALAHMRAHPAFAARAMLLKLVLFWNDFEISDS